MNPNTSDANSPIGGINDRAMPRWQLQSIACAILSEGRWHDMVVLDISLGGVKVRGHWDHALAVTTVSLGDKGPSNTDTFLFLQAEPIWVDQTRATTALRFDIPNRAVAANLLKFLSGHIAAYPSP